MRSVTTWSDRVPDRDGIKSVVNDICFKPDGTQLVAAVGNRVQRLLFVCASRSILSREHSPTCLRIRLPSSSHRVRHAGEHPVDTLGPLYRRGHTRFEPEACQSQSVSCYQKSWGGAGGRTHLASTCGLPKFSSIGSCCSQR